VWPLQTLIPGGFHSRHQAARIFSWNFPWSSGHRRPPRSPWRHRVPPGASEPSLSPPQSLCTVVPNHGGCPFTCRHLPRPKSVMPSTTQVPSPSPRRHSRAHNNVVLPEPVMMCTLCRSQASDTIDPRCPRACNAIVLPEPAMSSSPWRPRAHNAIDPTLSLGLQCCHPPEAHNATLYIFLCHFGLTNPDFDMLYCHIALICYIAFVLLHCFDVLATLLWYATLPLTCRIGLICYIAFDMMHCFDMLHCHIALICDIAFVLLHCFDVLHCHIALICYISFNMSHCFDTLHCFWYATLLLFCCIALMCFIVTLLWYATFPLTCHIALIRYIAFDMLHCFNMLHCHIAQWRKWVKWDDNMDQHYCTIQILASNNM
jgi:hypothetical protein